jgi:hypothetical protein
MNIQIDFELAPGHSACFWLHAPSVQIDEAMDWARHLCLGYTMGSGLSATVCQATIGRLRQPVYTPRDLIAKLAELRRRIAELERAP